MKAFSLGLMAGLTCLHPWTFPKGKTARSGGKCLACPMAQKRYALYTRDVSNTSRSLLELASEILMNGGT
jgi:hypothetical protein